MGLLDDLTNQAKNLQQKHGDSLKDLPAKAQEYLKANPDKLEEYKNKGLDALDGLANKTGTDMDDKLVDKLRGGNKQ